MAAALKTKLSEIIARLKKERPEAHCELTHKNPFELLISVILSAQCTDERVNQVTPGLFKKFPTPKAMAKASPPILEKEIYSTGFYKNKAKNIKAASEILVKKFNGQVPQSMEELLTLPGAARKTANVVLGEAFRIASGVVVDTHVSRVSQRLGLTKETTPEKIEQDLMKLIPRQEWIYASHALVLHGRYVCKAKKPDCQNCILNDLCPSKNISAP
jgi:endonuclease-3